MCLICGTTLVLTCRLFPLTDFPVREVHLYYQLSPNILNHCKEMVIRASLCIGDTYLELK